MKIVFIFCAAALAGCAGSLPRDARPATCVGHCLAGRDPYDSDCARDARTVRRAETRDAAGALALFVELQQSDRCRVAWARAVRMQHAPPPLVASVRAGRSSSTFGHAKDREVWTDMVPSGSACVTATATSGEAVGSILDAVATSCGEAPATRER